MQHKANRRDVFLMGLIDQYMKLYSITDEAMAKALGMGRATWYRRKKEPGTLTLDELTIICKRAQIPQEEMKARLWA